MNIRRSSTSARLARHVSLLRAAVQEHPVSKPDAAVIRITRVLAAARSSCFWGAAATKIETLARPAAATRDSVAKQRGAAMNDEMPQPPG